MMAVTDMADYAHLKSKVEAGAYALPVRNAVRVKETVIATVIVNQVLCACKGKGTVKKDYQQWN